MTGQRLLTFEETTIRQVRTPPAAHGDGPRTEWEGWDHVKRDLAAREMEVLEAVKELGQAAGFEIADHLDLDHNWISGRITSLKRKRLLRVVGKRLNPRTGVRQLVVESRF